MSLKGVPNKLPRIQKKETKILGEKEGQRKDAKKLFGVLNLPFACKEGWVGWVGSRAARC